MIASIKIIAICILAFFALYFVAQNSVQIHEVIASILIGACNFT